MGIYWLARTDTYVRICVERIGAHSSQAKHKSPMTGRHLGSAETHMFWLWVNWSSPCMYYVAKLYRGRCSKQLRVMKGGRWAGCRLTDISIIASFRIPAKGWHLFISQWDWITPIKMGPHLVLGSHCVLMRHCDSLKCPSLSTALLPLSVKISHPFQCRS